MALVPGTLLGVYEVVSPLGRGGMGEVYRARDTRLDRVVAIKVLREHLAADPDRRTRFDREARAISKLNHPNISTLYDVGNDNGVDFLVVEFIDGQTLADRLKKGALPIDQALAIGIDIAAALDAAHRAGIVHRDLKPANVMLTKSSAKLLDFGIAREIEREPLTATITRNTLTADGTLLGTVQYMSPEQLEGRAADARSDLFAFGAVLYEMLSGRQAFVGETQAAIAAAIIDHGVPSLTNASRAVDRIVQKCVAKSPEDRWQTARDLLDELKWVVAAPSKEPDPRDFASTGSSWRSRLSLLAVTGALVLAGLIWSNWRREPPVDISQHRYVPFAFASAQDFGGVWSRDGKSVAFIQGEALMAQSLDAGAPIQLTTGAAPPLSWSPDGTRILFRNASVTAEHPGVRAISRAGGEPEDIVTEDAVNSLGTERRPVYADLSPDGKTLAVWRYFRSADGHTRSSVWFSSESGSLQPYTPAPFAVFSTSTPVFLRFSPDGRLLYLSIYGADSGAATWVLPFPPGSGQPRQVFRNVSWRGPVNGSWMPDNRRMILSGNVAPFSKSVLWLADTSNNSLRRLTDREDSQTWPSVSPDGRHLLFTSVKRNMDIVELPFDGSAPKKLLATAVNEESPSWSMRGDQFAYVTDRNGMEELWIRSAHGDWDRPVATARDFPSFRGFSTPAISPDGSRVAYTAVIPSDGFALYVSPVAGGTPTWVANGTAPSWSPDGRAIAFVRWTKTGFPLATLRLGTHQQPTEIFSDRCESAPWSPSGEWIACATSNGPILVSPDGKHQRRLPSTGILALAWSNDSRMLYGLDSQRKALMAFDVNANTVRTVAQYGAEISEFYVGWAWGLQLSRSPDGKRVAVGAASTQQDLWILDGFDPQ